MNIIRAIGRVTVAQIVTVAFWTVAGPALVIATLAILVSLYLPVTVAALVYNRTAAHWLNTPAFRPYW